MLTSPWIESRARITPHRIAIECGEETLDYAELERRARNVAAALATRGIQPGDVCAALLPNGLHFAVLLHAADLLGATFLPLNTRLTPRELTYPLGDSAARLLLHGDDELGEKALLTAGSAPGVEAQSIAALVGHPDVELPQRPQDPVSPFAILYTSGTTGRPKGACLSRSNFVASATASALHCGVLPEDRWLACMPLFHVGGLSILVRSVLYGTAAVVHERFDPVAVDAALDRDGITLLSLTATMLARLLEVRGSRSAPGSLRCVLLGGGPCPAPLIADAAKLGFPIMPTYGLTEACSQVATRLVDEAEPTALSPLPGVEIRIVDDAGKSMPSTHPGEIWVRGETVMRSYLTQRGDNPRPDGWLRTGDIGTLDAQGRLYVHDRRSDLIISGGENVYPAEVEAVLAEHPAIAEVAVAGVPDASFGQRPAAWFTTRSGTSDPSTEELTHHCRERLAGFKIPVSFRAVGQLPRTSAGKVLRRELRKIE